MDTKKYLTPKDVEKIYGIKPPTVRCWARQGRIKFKKVGRLTLIPVDDLENRFDRIDRGENFFDERE